MNVKRLEPILERKVLFSLRDHKLVPGIPGCYILSTFDEDILYIGLSINLNVRFRQHLDNLEKTSLTELGKPTWFHFLPCSELELEKLERTWHNQYLNEHGYLPILNKIHSPLS